MPLTERFSEIMVSADEISALGMTYSDTPETASSSSVRESMISEMSSCDEAARRGYLSAHSCCSSWLFSTSYMTMAGLPVLTGCAVQPETIVRRQAQEWVGKWPPRSQQTPESRENGRQYWHSCRRSPAREAHQPRILCAGCARCPGSGGGRQAIRSLKSRRSWPRLRNPR